MSRFKDKPGQSIIEELRELNTTAANGLIAMVGRKDLPAEHRLNVARDTAAAAKALREEATQAVKAWSVEAVADARRRYHQDPVASAAEETRRNTQEVRLGTMLASARAEDARAGVRIPTGGNRPVNNASAWSMANKAEAAYLNGQYADAQLYARASMELGGPDSASLIFQHAQNQLDLDSPERARALKDIAAVQHAEKIFERDAAASASATYQAAAKLAQDAGDITVSRALNTEASRASMRAKLAAASLAEFHPDGTIVAGTYVEPSGVLPSGPTGGSIRQTDGELARRVDNVTVGS